MADKSKIEWTEATWNPIRGCSVVSEGCRNCYAMHMAARFSGPGQAYEGLAYRNASGAHWTGEVRLIEEHLLDPLRWKRPRRIFVNSMSDLFHESIPNGVIDRIFAVLALAPQHIFQVLTKRQNEMRKYFREQWHGRVADILMGWRDKRAADYDQQYLQGQAFGSLTCGPHESRFLSNVWLGVSVEDQKTADERIPLLMETPAAVRWISAEPLLGSIDLEAVPTLEGSIDWVVVGGESGPNARPMHPDWARSLRDQCVAARVPFFFKQWGAWLPVNPLEEGAEADGKTAVFTSEGERILPDCCSGEYITEFDEPFDDDLNPWRFQRVSKKAAGRLLDGKEWNQYPQDKAVAA